MLKNKMMIRLFGKGILVIIPLWICVFLIVLGKVNLGIPAFAVDSSDLLYVGTQRQIEVYEGTKLVHTISPHTSRTYVFTILEDDTILLSTSTKAYSMDLSGEILDSWEDNGTDVYNKLRSKRMQFVSGQGDQYKIKGLLGWTRIVKNNQEVVYKLPVFSFVIKMLFFVTIPCFIYYVIRTIGKQLESEDTGVRRNG